MLRKWTQEKPVREWGKLREGEEAKHVISGKVPVSAWSPSKVWSISCVPEFVSFQAKGFWASNTNQLLVMDSPAET